MIATAGWRGALARALLLVLAWAELPASALREAPVRVARAASLPEEPAARRAAFWFDPGYSAFVEAVRQATPESATICLVAPRTTDLYVYRAAYGLVPRRVVGPEQWASSDYVAVYHAAASLPVPSGRSIPGGTLLRR